MRALLPAILLPLLLGLPLTGQTQAPPGNPQCTDFTFNPTPVPALAQSTNPQTFVYNGAQLSLAGISSEYLCHLDQPGNYTDPFSHVVVTPNNAICTWANHREFINRLSTSGLNVLRLWLSLAQSVGKARGLGEPYAHEQPFVYNDNATCRASHTCQWSLSSYDQVFFQRLQCVVAYAATKNVMVELTLFDPWSESTSGSGTWASGPWAEAFNSEVSSGFTQKAFLARYQNTAGAGSDSGSNVNARTQQDNFVRKVVGDLNPYPNLYWEVANEPDLGGTVTGTAAMQWESHVASVIQGAEIGKKQHLIGVNVFTDAALMGLTPLAQIVSSHYVSAETGAGGDVGAIEMLRAREGTTGFTNRIFGFNETRATPDPSIPSSARSESWEFLLSEGGLYDNYNLSFKTAGGAIDSQTNKIFNQLGVLRGIAQQPLNNPDFASLKHDKNCGPTTSCWIRNLHAYGSSDSPLPCASPAPMWNGFTYWAAMHTPTVYLLYQHHSLLSHLDGGAPLTRYDPPPAGCPVAGFEYQETALQFRPEQAGNYQVRWIEPATGTVKSSVCKNGLVAGVDVALPASHKYAYDVALRITKMTTCVP